MRRPIVLLVLLPLAACIAGPSHVPAATMLPRERIALPAQYVDGYFLVAAILDGRGPYAFLIDTGTDRLVVDTRVAARHRSALRTTKLDVRGATGQAAPMAAVLHLRELRIGQAGFRDLEAGVLDLGPLSRALGARIDGLLGCSVFADCLLTLDYPRRAVYLEHGALPSPDGGDVLAMSGSTPWVVGALDDAPVELLLDSGFGREVALPPDLPGLRHSEPRTGGELVTITGVQPQIQARLYGTLQLGRHRFHRPWATLTPGSPKIGAGILRRFVMTLDLRNRRVQLLRPGG